MRVGLVFTNPFLFYLYFGIYIISDLVMLFNCEY